MPFSDDNENIILNAGFAEDWGFIPGQRSNLDPKFLEEVERYYAEKEASRPHGEDYVPEFTKEQADQMDEVEKEWNDAYEANLQEKKEQKMDGSGDHPMTEMQEFILSSLREAKANHIAPITGQKRKHSSEPSEPTLGQARYANSTNPKKNTFRQKIRKLHKTLAKEWKDEWDQYIERDIEDHEGHDIYDVVTEDKRLSDYSEGLKLFNKGLQSIHHMGITPTRTQNDFIRKIFDCCIPHIYRDEFPKFREYLLKKARKQTFERGAFLSCPRQFGKSTTVALACAAMLLIGRGLNIVVVANSQDIASKMKNQIISYYMNLSKFKKEGSTQSEYKPRILLQNQRMACVACADADPNLTNAELRQRMEWNMVRACSRNATTQRCQLFLNKKSCKKTF